MSGVCDFDTHYTLAHERTWLWCLVTMLLQDMISMLSNSSSLMKSDSANSRRFFFYHLTEEVLIYQKDGVED